MSRVSLLMVLALGGCNDPASLALPPADGGADLARAGDLASGGPCAVDRAGDPFTFHVTNGGGRMLRLTFGCGAALPITLDTPMGALGISPGPANGCEVSCDWVYAGNSNNGCSDCGPGYGAALPPGATVDIAWDHRVYVAFTADPLCSGHPAGNDCALGTRVGAGVTSGTLTVCNGGSPTAGAGYCSSTDQVAVPFTFDPALSAATLQVH